jgi:hypothetical protein
MHVLLRRFWAAGGLLSLLFSLLAVTASPWEAVAANAVTVSKNGPHAAVVSWEAPTLSGDPVTGFRVVAAGGRVPIEQSVDAWARSVSFDTLENESLLWRFTVLAERVSGDVELGTASMELDPSDRFVPLTPARLMDSRENELTVDGVLAGEGIVPGGTTITVPVVRRGGVAANASSVALTVTAVNAADPGFLTVYPCSATRPNTSVANYVVDATVAGAIVAKVGTTGAVCIYASGTTHLIVDVTGYVPPGAGYVGIVPTRRLDTRTGDYDIGVTYTSGPVVAGDDVHVDLAVYGADPLFASPIEAAAVTITVVDPAADGFVMLHPCGDKNPPTTSVVNYRAGQTVANTVFAPGGFCLRSTASTHVLVDATGYVPLGQSFGLVPATRLLDTRATGSTMRTAEQVTEVAVAGTSGVPGNADSVALNVTVDQPQGSGWVTAFPCGTARPLASTVNFVSGSNKANSTVVKVGANGKVCLFTSEATHLIVDVNGYAAPGRPLRVVRQDCVPEGATSLFFNLPLTTSQPAMWPVVGGTTPYSFAAIDLGAGWVVSPSGQITRTTSTNRDYTRFTMRITDSAGLALNLPTFLTNTAPLPGTC